MFCHLKSNDFSVLVWCYQFYKSVRKSKRILNFRPLRSFVADFPVFFYLCHGTIENPSRDKLSWAARAFACACQTSSTYLQFPTCNLATFLWKPSKMRLLQCKTVDLKLLVLLLGQTQSALLYQRLTGLATDSNPCLQLLEQYFLPAIIQVASLDIRNRARTQSLMIHHKYKESLFGPLDFVIQANKSPQLLLIGCCCW